MDGIQDIIVTNAQVETGNPSRPWASGFAIFDGKLAALASSAEIHKLGRSRALSLSAENPHSKLSMIDAKGQSIRLSPDIKVGSSVRFSMSEAGEITVLPAL